MTVLPAETVRVTKPDATLDLIAFENAALRLGDTARASRLAGYVEAILEANPELVAAGPLLPLGATVHLPEWRIVEDKQSVRLWD
ncbi:tail protein X [Stappia stellulata]|uniref:tail protein X n=1 Tax=Stappia stellulata TaxID=71235 RepID=UPI00040A0C3B|nr:tail protein X [Stappia stellulata]